MRARPPNSNQKPLRVTFEHSSIKESNVVSSVHKPQVGAKNDIAKEEFFTKFKMGMEQGETEKRNTESTNLEEYENIFNVIDSELDALRSSINEESSKDNGPLPSVDDNASLERDSILIDEFPEKKTTQGIPPSYIITAFFATILAFAYHMMSQGPGENSEGKIIMQDSRGQGGNIFYRESRKVERCRFVNGDKYCESEAAGSSSTSSATSGKLYQQATFQKCRYINGESYCESFEKSLSNGNEGISKAQLMKEFRQADSNKDGQVDIKEFEAYKKQYLKEHPEMGSSFANFGDFDHDSNGKISVQEHEEYYKALGLL